MAECFPEKSRWCWNEQVCQGVKCKTLSRTGNHAIYECTFFTLRSNIYVDNYILITIICIWIGDFAQGDFIQEGYCLGGYCPRGILSGEILSEGDCLDTRTGRQAWTKQYGQRESTAHKPANSSGRPHVEVKNMDEFKF